MEEHRRCVALRSPAIPSLAEESDINSVGLINTRSGQRFEEENRRPLIEWLPEQSVFLWEDSLADGSEEGWNINSAGLMNNGSSWSVEGENKKLLIEWLSECFVLSWFSPPPPPETMPFLHWLRSVKRGGTSITAASFILETSGGRIAWELCRGRWCSSMVL